MRYAVLLALASVAGAQETGLTAREKLLLERVERLERRVAELEAARSADAPAAAIPAAPAPASTGPATRTALAAPTALADPGSAGLGADFTVNFLFDGYYGYNFNRPPGRVNLLRAYDVTSNNFSINQTGIVLERAPQPAQGRRFGLRLDLQWGQATETLSASFANEPRPQVWRNLFQAYGTYVAPLGRGLTIDFGKWACTIGFEGNYTKDQLNYSRSYTFNFLPFYHMGLRTAYSFSDRFTAGYWLVNGIGQTEDFNSAKSQNFTFTWKPTASAAWTWNYYTGIESPDTVPLVNPGPPALPTQAGLSTSVIRPAPRGRTHIVDTYLSWDVTAGTTLVGEADYFLRRFHASGAPSHVSIGALYARHRFTPAFSLAARAEYLSDRGGLFSGVTQDLKETTFTADYQVADGFLLRGEWRRDFSNRPFFPTVPGPLKKEQNTATLGVIWWAGRKQGAW